MRKFSLNLKYAVKNNTAEQNKSMTLDYITYAVNKKYEKGLEGQLRRMWGRIQRRFDDAIENKIDEIELEDTEFDFVKKAFSECEYPSVISKYINILEDNFEQKIKEETKK